MSKILVIDDESSVRNAFQDMLVELGHEVMTANSGEVGGLLI